MRIIKEYCAGLIIDIQERLHPHMYHHDQLERNTEILIKGLKILEIPILLTEQYPQGLGPIIPSFRELLGNYGALQKMSFSCCDDPAFEVELNKTGKTQIIIAGIEAHVCVLQTVVDLLEFGFQPVVVADCVSSRKENDKIIALGRMQQEGAIITSYESILFELARISGTPVFKEISALVK